MYATETEQHGATNNDILLSFIRSSLKFSFLSLSSSFPLTLAMCVCVCSVQLFSRTLFARADCIIVFKLKTWGQFKSLFTHFPVVCSCGMLVAHSI